MLRHYEVSLPGPSHEKRGIPCQDSFAIAECHGVIIAAVADGLGSQSHSQVGSRVAADAAVDFCKQRLTSLTRSNDAASMLRGAYYAAYEAVLDEATRIGITPSQMDCTLCLALFDGRAVAYGQSGDSGLVVALDDGSYEVITRMQRDDEGRVFPLCFDDHWEFGCREGVATVLLCTDGVLEDLIAPPILARHADNPIDARLARGFLHPDPQAAGGLEALQADAERYLSEYPEELLDDDKTAVVVFDDERPPAEMSAPYYEGPDWDAVCAKAHALIACAESDQSAQPDSPGETSDASQPHIRASFGASAAPYTAEHVAGLIGAGIETAVLVAAESGTKAAKRINECRHTKGSRRHGKPKRRA